MTEVDSQPGDSNTDQGPDEFDRFKALDLKERLRVLAIGIFVVFHIGVALAWGSGNKVRDVIKPVAFWYGGGLKLAGTWGMFSSPGKMSINYVYGVERSGERVVLSPPVQSTLYQSLVDMRERKMRSRLGEKQQREYWGYGYLESFCRKPDGSFFQRVELDKAEHNEEHRWGSHKVELSRSCYRIRREHERGQAQGEEQ